MIKKFRYGDLFDSTCCKWTSETWYRKSKCVCACVMCAGQMVSHTERSWCVVSHSVSLYNTYTFLQRICLSVSSSKSGALSPSPSLPLSLFLSPAVALSLCHPLPDYFFIPHTHVLPCLSKMGWVESWLRTFMPKTTCHPSLRLSRMVMLLEVSTVDHGRLCKI